MKYYITLIAKGLVLTAISALLAILLFQSDTQDSSTKVSVQKETATLQTTLSEDVIRLHVIANSDTCNDQYLKLKLKNYVVNRLGTDMRSSTSYEDANAFLQNILPSLEQECNSFLRSQGSSQTATLELGSSWFPAKMYGQLIFPPGNYYALRIQIGKAKGRNWWCVMFPALCFVDESYQVVTPESTSQLEESLTSEQFQELTGTSSTETKVEYRSGLAEWWNNINPF